MTKSLREINPLFRELLPAPAVGRWGTSFRGTQSQGNPVLGMAGSD